MSGQKTFGIQSLMRHVRSDAARIIKPDVMFDNSITASEVTSHKIFIYIECYNGTMHG